MLQVFPTCDYTYSRCDHRVPSISGKIDPNPVYYVVAYYPGAHSVDRDRYLSAEGESSPDTPKLFVEPGLNTLFRRK
jgi:hypothetical protein